MEFRAPPRQQICEYQATSKIRLALLVYRIGITTNSIKWYVTGLIRIFAMSFSPKHFRPKTSESFFHF